MVNATASSILSFAHCSPGDVSISCISRFFKVCGLNVIQAANRKKTMLKALLALVCSSMLHTEAREDTCSAFTSLRNEC